MATAMLDVINNSSLRESLIKRGYEYVERNGWQLKKKEYLDLIDSLSTERFDDVDPTLLRLAELEAKPHGRDEASAVSKAHVDRIAIPLDDCRSAPTSNKN
jgi:hypothetical protein